MVNNNFKGILVLLAGGKSERMQQPKGLLPLRDRTLLECHLENFSKAGGQQAVIGLGFQENIYRNQFGWKTKGAKEAFSFQGLKLRLAINPNPDQGQFSTLLNALDSIGEEETNPVFVLPVDLIPPQPSTYQRLMGSLQEKAFAKPVFGGKGGHPVLLSISFTKNLLSVPHNQDQARLDYQLSLVPAENRCLVEVDDKRILANLNHPEDYRNLINTLA